MTTAKNTKQKSEKVISDYNGYDYKKIFWEDADRKYEDMADRIAIRKLLPEKMENFVDIAGGYGRLADEYIHRAKKSTIFDYSKTELKQAKDKYGDKINTKAGDIYALPFKDNEFDSLLMVRATHHFKEMQKVSNELYRVLAPGGIAVIEVANKKTLPKMFRYWFKKSDVNPFDRKPSHLKDLNKDGFYNYHPKYIEEVFKKSGFKIKKVRSVSNFRSTKLKKIFGTKVLVRLEKSAQVTLAPVRFAPSIYYQLEKPKN
ncbi:class I SAM-dependent methyltransferase [Candidatus Saccharibacteria bacterium]|nr:class I SAM-dependent methyltransferase [Candidatus Saccharibacteria bacterium]